MKVKLFETDFVDTVIEILKGYKTSQNYKGSPNKGTITEEVAGRTKFDHWITQAVIDQICCRLIDSIANEQEGWRQQVNVGLQDNFLPHEQNLGNDLEDVSNRFN